MINCYIGLGSNLGDRRQNIKQALSSLKKTKSISVSKVSKVYQTLPIGGPKQGKYLNAAVKLKTSLGPHKLLRLLKRIEKDLGRTKSVRWGARVIDLDILLYEDQIIQQKDLKIPHPRMFEREFVLKPLSEVL